MSTKTTDFSVGRSTDRRIIEIDFLFLDLNTCTRCVGTNKNLEEALNSVEHVLLLADVMVQVNKVLIDSPEMARAHRFVTSPTIRVNGRDIALETKESKCDSCTDLCGCAEGTDCRVWVFRGQEYTEAPVAMIVEAVLQEVFQTSSATNSAILEYEDVPRNLERFFDATAARATRQVSSCCSPAQQQTCCEPSEKASCCGETVQQSSGCGCQ